MILLRCYEEFRKVLILYREMFLIIEASYVFDSELTKTEIV